MKVYCSLTLILAATLALSGCAADGGTGSNKADSHADAGSDATADTSADTTIQGLSVASIDPNTGQVEGGDDVVISGTGFQDGATVYFGDAEASTTFVSQTELDATTPAVSDAGPVDVVVKNPDGTEATLTQGFTYANIASPAQVVDWCKIQHPASTTTKVGTETEPIFGRAFVQNCSEGSAQCDTLHAELGWGPEGSDPTDASSGWTWTSASYNADHTNDDNDEYQATLTPDAEGTFSYAYRFWIDGSSERVYCDLDGVEPLGSSSFDLDQMGNLNVEPATTPTTVTIDWCKLQWPESTSTTVGTDTEAIYGRVYSSGCTDGTAQCDGITAQLGYGPSDGDPTSDATAYTWVDATYNAGHTSDNNDEYQATLNVSDAGDYGYAYRFSGDGGSTWTYCDLDDTHNGFQKRPTGHADREPITGN